MGDQPVRLYERCAPNECIPDKSGFCMICRHEVLREVDEDGTPIPVTDDEHEYAVQWVSTKIDHRLSVFPDDWGTRSWAKVEQKRLTEKVVGSADDPQPWRFELVRRLRPGAVEVVHEEDNTTR